MIYGTDLCDSKCKHCLIWAKRPPKHLPFDKIKELMNNKCVTKSTTVGLEGGEFLLHPEAFEIMKWFKKNHDNFDLLSNCLKPDNVIEAVKKYPPKRLYLSLDGGQETYKYMRGKDGYDSVIKVIEACKDIAPVSTMFTLSPYNSFDDLRYVAETCKKLGVDMRVGVYNNIDFFDTVDKAHDADIGSRKTDELWNFSTVKALQDEAEAQGVSGAVLEKPVEVKEMNPKTFVENIPEIVKEFSENYDFLVLYDQWRRKNVQMNCYSILDSIVVLPNGDVPICQNLDTKLGNIYDNTLDEILNSKETQEVQNHHVHNCNGCWINFHRKYDVILYRTFEKYFGKGVTGKLFGYYQWKDDKQATYAQYMKEVGA